jgi:molybdate transport system substrate-binding protein
VRRAVPNRRTAFAWRLALGVVVVPLTGCLADDVETPRPTRLDVFAASSLLESFRDLEEAFEAREPDVDVVPTFAGSQVLRLQIAQGANAEVFASANPEHLDALVDAGLMRPRGVFAHNELVVITSPDDRRIQNLDDLPEARRLVIGVRAVPVGRYTRALLERASAARGDDFAARVLDRVVSEESNVRLVRAKVELGEADAAIVYATDAAASDRVRTIPIREDLNVRADYVLGLAPDAGAAADAFLAFVRSPAGRDILRRHGFVPAAVPPRGLESERPVDVR